MSFLHKKAYQVGKRVQSCLKSQHTDVITITKISITQEETERNVQVLTDTSHTHTPKALVLLHLQILDQHIYCHNKNYNPKHR